MKKASKYLKQLFSAIVAAVKGTRAGSLRTRLLILSILRNKKLLVSAIQSKINAIMGGAAGGSSSSGGHGYGNALAAAHHAAGEHVHGDGQHLLLGGGGGRKAAVLQSLPSFVVEQETRAVVLLSSLPSFALDRDGGAAGLARSPLSGGGDHQEPEDNDGDDIGEKQLAVDVAPAVSATELARGAAEGGGAEFRLEDEIDRVADVFIRRFHDQMKLQKLESFKRFCEMIERGA
ncbi:hypothetical protein ACP4OV_006534 [Aristida adscensionis]